MDQDFTDAETDKPAEQGLVHAMFDIRHLSMAQLAKLGVSQIAYVKPVTLNGEHAFAIHAADGTPMAVTEDQATAVAAIRQHEMMAALVH